MYSLGKLGELAVGLVAERLDLGDKLGLGRLAITGGVDLLLKVLDVLGLEELDESVELGELLLNDGGRGRGALGLEVVGRRNDGRDGLWCG